MPNPDGTLTENDIKYIQEWMSKYSSHDNKCPICGEINWTIGQHLVQSVTANGYGQFQFNAPSYPNVMLLSPCGILVT